MLASKNRQRRTRSRPSPGLASMALWEQRKYGSLPSNLRPRGVPSIPIRLKPPRPLPRLCRPTVVKGIWINVDVISSGLQYEHKPPPVQEGA